MKSRQNIDSNSKSGVNLSRHCYKSNSFNIKYIEEECDLNEVVYFEMMVDLPKVEEAGDVSALRIPLNMEVSLYYADDPDELEMNKRKGALKFNYEKVSVRSYRIGNLMSGIYKFVPVEFTYSLASVLYTSVH